VGQQDAQRAFVPPVNRDPGDEGPVRGRERPVDRPVLVHLAVQLEEPLASTATWPASTSVCADASTATWPASCCVASSATACGTAGAAAPSVSLATASSRAAASRASATASPSSGRA